MKKEILLLHRKSRAKPHLVWDAIMVNNPEFKETEEILRQIFPHFTGSERRISTLIIHNFDSYEIGSMLNEEKETVDNHRSHIRKKLNLKKGELKKTLQKHVKPKLL